MKKKVIILEDNGDIRELVEILLSMESIGFQSYSTAREFWQDLDNMEPGLFLLDVRLPDGNGIDICNKLRTLSNTSNIPIMIMSAHLKDTGPCKADDFVTKPFNIDDFVNRINVQLQKAAN